ncbi:hypothetical protein OUZ56_031299 [Daphnia magna]|uniref:Uncharacterized protein n=1 Tax=Daphnia magna TaxID=35525 RepID=A0ABQ9ZTV5_9CRUS|nr:hypothetical protein OUZ56_031299 [Daphnia magna]
MAQLAHGYQELPSWFSDLETSIVKSFQVCYGRRTADDGVGGGILPSGRTQTVEALKNDIGKERALLNWIEIATSEEERHLLEELSSCNQNVATLLLIRNVVVQGDCRI